MRAPLLVLGDFIMTKGREREGLEPKIRPSAVHVHFDAQWLLLRDGQPKRQSDLEPSRGKKRGQFKSRRLFLVHFFSFLFFCRIRLNRSRRESA